MTEPGVHLSADASRIAGLRAALQPVADSVRDVAGFEVAAISVLRLDKRFEYVVVSSVEDYSEELVGQGNPLEVIEEQNRNAQRWGRFDFVPHDVQHAIEGEATWTPDVTYPDVEDAFHPDDMLSTLLRSEKGDIIGMLSLDIPINGRRPGTEQLALMEAFGTHAERVLRQALAQREVDERLRLASTARRIVHNASSSMSLEEILVECEPALLEGFDLHGLWIQFFAGPLGNQPRVTNASGFVLDVPGHLVEIAQRAAQAGWERQTVNFISDTSEVSLVTEEEHRLIVEFLEQIGIGSMLFVPMGAGDVALGNLVLTRADPHQEWTRAEQATAQELGRDLGQALLNAELFERNRRLVTELQELGDYKRMLVDMMVHELKNPLAAITGYVEMAQSADVPPLVEQALESIDRSAGRLMELVENLLTLSQVNEQVGDSSFAAVDLAPLLARSVEIAQVRARAKDIELTLSCPEPARVWGDPELLELVCSNLISNAVKYTPEGGRVRVTVHELDGHLVMRVADTGLGISTQDQSRLFDEFFRSSNPTAVAEPGTGLGLTIVARVVAQHHGTITVESELGAGSTFEVRLPSAQSAQQ